MIEKDRLLAEAASRVETVRDAVKNEIAVVTETLGRLDRQRNDPASDPTVRNKLVRHFDERLDQLHHLFPSPYFFRCDVRNAAGNTESWYFGKFQMMEQSIFSWMSPAARLRFSDIGPELRRKDQFMIVGGHIVFMASEGEGYGRTLIHQEALSQRKAGFLLPEIVERMERAQDDVIRAPDTGSFLIAGPAGSGKTTLAFHRIAYLVQSPDTGARFPSQDVIVFVQDEGTRAYFSKLLPDLGIHDVRVTTFGAWALERLGIKDGAFVRRANGVDPDVDAYERKKRDAMRSGLAVGKPRGGPFDRLRTVYEPTFERSDLARLTAQSKANELDRFDLAILLRAMRDEAGAFTREEEYLVQKKNFEVTRKRRTVPLTYPLIVVDEAQNYLPEQIELMRSCASQETKAMLYVGDLGQQVLLGTITDWTEAGESFGQGQRVELDKVYRNTKQILSYLGTLGFRVSIPDGLKEGPDVTDETCADVDEEIARVAAILNAKDGQAHLGVLCPSSNGLDPFRRAFGDRSDVHVLTVHESQGVEFDAVCLVGVPEDFLAVDDAELLKIKRDLLYVALTRAMEELHVFGRTRLTEIFSRPTAGNTTRAAQTS